MNQLITIASQVGPVLRAARKRSKLTQAQLAARLGMSQSRLSELEGDASSMSVGQLFAVLASLGLEVRIQARGESPNNAGKVEW
jgi:HTH-type transcriptional regulator / antitoxin HipB